MLRKNSSEKSAKNVFLYSHEYRDQKMGGKTRETIFPRNTGIVLEKNLRKNVRKTFFYIHTNIVTKKWWEQNAQNNFSRYTRIVRAKNFGEKIVVKNCENRFFIFTRISLTKNGGKKTRETIFPETQGECVQKMLGKKFSGKTAKNVFLYHTNILIKK